MKRKSIGWIVAVGTVLVLAYLVYGTTRLVQVECSLCVEFNGQRECPKGTGTSTDNAKRAAQKAACGVLAAGMDQTIACERTMPTDVQCPPGHPSS